MCVHVHICAQKCVIQNWPIIQRSIHPYVYIYILLLLLLSLLLLFIIIIIIYYYYCCYYYYVLYYDMFLHQVLPFFSIG